jgi:hypothetical protein
MAIREINKLLASHNLTNIDGEIMWKNLRKLKEEFHINGISMQTLIRGASPFLA